MGHPVIQLFILCSKTIYVEKKPNLIVMEYLWKMSTDSYYDLASHFCDMHMNHYVTKQEL